MPSKRNTAIMVKKLVKRLEKLGKTPAAEKLKGRIVRAAGENSHNKIVNDLRKEGYGSVPQSDSSLQAAPLPSDDKAPLTMSRSSAIQPLSEGVAPQVPKSERKTNVEEKQKSIYVDPDLLKALDAITIPELPPPNTSPYQTPHIGVKLQNMIANILLSLTLAKTEEEILKFCSNYPSNTLLADIFSFFEQYFLEKNKDDALITSSFDTATAELIGGIKNPKLLGSTAKMQSEGNKFLSSLIEMSHLERYSLTSQVLAAILEELVKLSKEQYSIISTIKLNALGYKEFDLGSSPKQRTVTFGLMNPLCSAVQEHFKQGEFLNAVTAVKADTPASQKILLCCLVRMLVKLQGMLSTHTIPIFESKPKPESKVCSHHAGMNMK